jgi:thiazolylpeptide-type bacteriocin precursor
MTDVIKMVSCVKRRPRELVARAARCTESSCSKSCVITSEGFTMSTNTADFAATFASFDIAELEVLEVSAGTALPEMGASHASYVGCSSSSSSSCC